MKLKKKNTYLTSGSLKHKMENSQYFTNIKNIDENGIIHLKSNELAIFYKINPVDLSLTNDREQEIFFSTLAKLYRLPFTIKAYKFDEQINLNINKENYDRLIEEQKDNPARLEILE